MSSIDSERSRRTTTWRMMPRWMGVVSCVSLRHVSGPGSSEGKCADRCPGRTRGWRTKVVYSAIDGSLVCHGGGLVGYGGRLVGDRGKKGSDKSWHAAVDQDFIEEALNHRSLPRTVSGSTRSTSSLLPPSRPHFNISKLSLAVILPRATTSMLSVSSVP